ncbi:hypothetical protein GOODEAATRI_002341, partial [Goodea atripinnis]
ASSSLHVFIKGRTAHPVALKLRVCTSEDYINGTLKFPHCTLPRLWRITPLCLRDWQRM